MFITPHTVANGLTLILQYNDIKLHVNIIIYQKTQLALYNHVLFAC